MKEVKMNTQKFEGYAITVEAEGSVEEYAMSFLHIFNNVRENKELLKIKNYYSNNNITVYCALDFKEALIKYLRMFGEIKGCEKVLIYQMEEPDYDFDKYDDVIVATEFEY